MDQTQSPWIQIRSPPATNSDAFVLQPSVSPGPGSAEATSSATRHSRLIPPCRASPSSTSSGCSSRWPITPRLWGTTWCCSPATKAKVRPDQDAQTQHGINGTVPHLDSIEKSPWKHLGTSWDTNKDSSASPLLGDFQLNCYCSWLSKRAGRNCWCQKKEPSMGFNYMIWTGRCRCNLMLSAAITLN